MKTPVGAVCLDVTLFIRCLELARETIKTDEELHKFVEQVVAQQEGKDLLTMDDYADLVSQDPQLEQSQVKQLLASTKTRLVKASEDDPLMTGKKWRDFRPKKCTCPTSRKIDPKCPMHGEG